LLAGVVFGWPVVAVAALCEGAALWVLPDIPAVKKNLDAENRYDQIGEQRRYYLKKIFDATPKTPSSGFFSLFVSPETDWTLPSRDEWGYFYEYVDTRKFKQYERLIAIVKELRVIMGVHSDQVTEPQIQALDEAVNTWLKLIYTAQSLDETLQGMSRKDLEKEARELATAQEKSRGDRAAEIVLHQRLINLKQKVEALPALEQRKGLALAQAERLVSQAETFLNTVRTSESGDATALDFMVDRYQLLEGPFDMAAAQTEIQLLDEGDNLLDQIQVGLEIQSERAHQGGEAGK